MEVEYGKVTLNLSDGAREEKLAASADFHRHIAHHINVGCWQYTEDGIVWRRVDGVEVELIDKEDYREALERWHSGGS